MKTQVKVISKIENVAKPFSRAIWREREVGRVYDSVQAMKAAGHSPANSNYDFIYDDDNGNEIVVRSVRNGRLTGY